MAEPIVGHGHSVAPEELWSAVAALERCVDELRRAWQGSFAVSVVAPNLTHEIGMAIRQAIELRSRLEQCIRAYSQAETDAHQRAQSLAASLGWWAGFSIHSGLFLPASGLAAGIFSQLPWQRRDRFASELRLGVESVDDVLLGAAGVPWMAARNNAPAWLSAQLSAPGSAQQDVQLIEQSSGPATPPGSVSELVQRIPASTAQVRVEAYGTAAEPAWVVYVAGTRSTQLGGTEPFDMRSNLAEVAGTPAASQTAVEQAMVWAGAKPGDRVLLVGHLQGGMVAARIAESGRYRVEQCVTVGAPLGTISSSVPTLAVEYRQDPVPTLAGVSEPSDSKISYIADAPPASDRSLIGPHQLIEYRQTAAQLDRSGDPAIVEVNQRIRDFASGDGTAVEYRAQRSL